MQGEISVKKTFFFLTTALTACAADIPEPKGAKAKKNIATDAYSSDALKTQETATLSKLIELKAQNNALCLRVQKQRVECPVAGASLRSEDDQTILGCVSGVDPNAKVDSNFELDISIPKGSKAILTTKNGMWQTQAVSSGQNHKLTWGPRTKSPCDLLPPKTQATLVKSPRLIELTDMSLKVFPDSCSDSKSYKADDISSFNLRINGYSLFDRSDLGDSSSGIQVSLQKILNSSQDPKCVVPKDELFKLMEEAKGSVQSSTAVAPNDLEAQFARETSRNDQLLKQLGGTGHIGCWGYSKLKKFQVKIDGAALPNSNLGDGRSAKKNSGNSRQYTFTFGQNMEHTISDESQNAVFRTGGGFIIDTFAEREIQELRGLRIRKGGVAYQNDAFRMNGFLGIGGWSGFHRYEKDRRSLSKIQIFANDQLVFEKSGINFTFEESKLVWPSNSGSENIQNSPAFMTLMTRTDCPAD